MRLVLLFCAIASVSAHALLPHRPVFAESFSLHGSAMIDVDGHTAHGKCQWMITHVDGMGRKELRFPDAPQYNLVQVMRYDQSVDYQVIVENDSSRCRPVAVRTPMPTVWSWIKQASFAGRRQFGENFLNIWTYEGMDNEYTVGVLTTDHQSLQYYREYNPLSGRSLELFVDSFEWGAPNADLHADLFDTPNECPPPQAVLAMLPPDHHAELFGEASGFTAVNVTAGGNMAAVLDKAKEIGTCGCPYVWGGNGPCCYGQTSGYDCSGLTTRAYGAGGWSIPRTAQTQQNTGRGCSGGYSAGDLLFWGTPAYHVVMYIGNNQIAECPDVGLNCWIKPFRNPSGGCRRIA